MADEKEPLITRAGIIAVATTAVSLIAALGLPISQEATNAVLGVIAAVAPLLVAAWARQKVFSPATVAGIEEVLKRPPAKRR